MCHILVKVLEHQIVGFCMWGVFSPHETPAQVPVSLRTFAEFFYLLLYYFFGYAAVAYYNDKYEISDITCVGYGNVLSQVIVIHIQIHSIKEVFIVYPFLLIKHPFTESATIYVHQVAYHFNEKKS